MRIQQIESGIKRWIGEQTWLDAAAEPIQQAITRFYHRLGEAGQFLADFFNGVWLGHPLHPVITDVTIGALGSAVTLDLLEQTTGQRAFGPGADASLLLGVSSGLGAAAAGLTDWQHTTGESRRTGILHAALNTTSMVFYVASLLSRRKGERAAGRRLALTGFFFSVAAAFLGGDLTYRQKIGVNHTPIRTLPETYQDVMALEELPEERLVRVEVQEVPVLLLRRGSQIYAISEICAHLGGPLSEGVLHSDNSVSCPWHGSRFDLETGRVINGPSAYSQTCYQVLVQDGRVHIRPAPHGQNVMAE